MVLNYLDCITGDICFMCESSYAICFDAKVLKRDNERIEEYNQEKIAATLKSLFRTSREVDKVEADRVIVMEKGRKVLEGTPREVFSNIKMLREIGLDVPYMTELANLLSEEGLKISNDILTVDEMVMELCQL